MKRRISGYSVSLITREIDNRFDKNTRNTALFSWLSIFLYLIPISIIVCNFILSFWCKAVLTLFLFLYTQWMLLRPAECCGDHSTNVCKVRPPCHFRRISLVRRLNIKFSCRWQTTWNLSSQDGRYDFDDLYSNVSSVCTSFYNTAFLTIFNAFLRTTLQKYTGTNIPPYQRTKIYAHKN